MIIDIPIEYEWVDLDLLPAGDRSGEHAPGTATRVSLSMPCVVQLPPDREKLGNELYEFLREERKRYELKAMVLACSFVSRDAPLLKAILAISLERDDGIAENRPVAWNLTPERLTKPGTHFSSTFSLELSINPKVRVEVAEQPTTQDDQHILIAHGEGSSTPEWEFKRTKQSDFDGIHRIGMTIMTPRGAPATARLALSALIRHRKLGLIPCSANLPPQLQLAAL